MSDIKVKVGDVVEYMGGKFTCVGAPSDELQRKIDLALYKKYTREDIARAFGARRPSTALLEAAVRHANSEQAKIGYAAGVRLDQLGALYGVKRKDGETDWLYRLSILDMVEKGLREAEPRRAEAPAARVEDSIPTWCERCGRGLRAERRGGPVGYTCGRDGCLAGICGRCLQIAGGRCPAHEASRGGFEDIPTKPGGY